MDEKERESVCVPPFFRNDLDFERNKARPKDHRYRRTSAAITSIRNESWKASCASSTVSMKTICVERWKEVSDL